MFDPYYQTTVNMRWGRSPAAIILGLGLILLGICGIIFSSIDASSRSQNHVGIGSVLPDGTVTYSPTICSDYSIWATLGKGIWVGLFFIATGMIAICSQRERTSKAIAASTIMASLSAIFGLFLMLSAIPQLEYYNAYNQSNTPELRTNRENTEYTMNALLLTTGILGFLIASILACLGCFVDACNDSRSRGPRGPSAPRAYRPMPYGMPYGMPNRMPPRGPPRPRR